MHWQNWSPNQEYHIGDSVVYQGRTYHIIQPHISQADWTPSECPALWGQGNPVGSEIGRHPGPQDRHSPPPYNRGGQGGMPGMGYDQHRDAPKEGHYVAPQPEHPRGIPQPEHTRGIPEPAPNRGFPEPDHNRAPPQPERNRGFPDPERNRGFPEPDRHRGFPDPEHNRGPPDYEPGNRDHDRDWREKEDDRDRDRREREDDRDRESRRDREYGSRDRQRDYEGEDREMRGGHQRGHGDGEYCNPVKYNSSAEWIDDARRRTREVNMNGPGERIYWLLAEPGQIPKHAIQAGEDRNGDPTFVSRNFHEGGLHVGWAGLRHAAISYGGREIPLTTFEVLVGDPRGVRWAASKKRDGRPIEAGYEANGKPLWICQTLVGDQILAGKTASWETGGYIANDGKEEAVPEYNVLCHA